MVPHFQVGQPRWHPGRYRRGVRRLETEDPFWPAQLMLVVVIGLYFALPAELRIGPVWIIPLAEVLLLGGLVFATPRVVTDEHHGRRRLALGLTGLVAAANIAALVLLAHNLLNGPSTSGRALLGGGLIVWTTNVIVFGLWFWELDRGGPAARRLYPDAQPDFFFPAMDPDVPAPKGWVPSFPDYFYVSITNSTAFSPTDTMPLTIRAKTLMGIQGVVSLVTLGLIVARAVNILH
jgi:uncharacterized membrane protein